MPKIDCVCCLLFRYVNVTKHRTYKQGTWQSSSCVLGRNEKMEEGDAWICYQSRGLLRSPTTSSVPSRVSRPLVSRVLPEALWCILLPGSTKHSSIRVSSLTDTRDIPIRRISRYILSRIFCDFSSSNFCIIEFFYIGSLESLQFSYVDILIFF